MKLDTRALRYLTPEDWRVLTAVELGSKNHEIVPTSLIISISSLRGGSTSIHKSISTLAKAGLIAKLRNAKYDGYRLTYGGLDYLALHTHRQSAAIYSIGNQIGVGKESDIHVCAAAPTPTPARQQTTSAQTLVLKIHRLGRISFRSVKANRDYLRHRTTGSWQYLSRLAAQKEYAIMRALHTAGFPIPRPIAQSRHTVLMEFIDAFPLRQISSVPDPAALYAELIQMILRLAAHGLIHGDFNEFNILIREDSVATSSASSSSEGPKATSSEAPSKTKITLTPILIDFPQALSIDHPNAAKYFDRDVTCIKRFFSRRFGFTATEAGPSFQHARNLAAAASAAGSNGARRLDIDVEAAGFSKKMVKELDAYMKEVGPESGDDGTVSGGDDEEGDEDDEGEEVQEGDTPDDIGFPNAVGVQAEEEDVEPAADATVTSVNSWNLKSLEAQLDGVDRTAPESLAHGQRTKIRSSKAAAGWSI